MTDLFSSLPLSTAFTGLMGGVQLHDTTISSNADGSLHFDGLVTFANALSTDYYYMGNLAVDSYNDVEADYSTFTVPSHYPAWSTPGSS